MIRDLANKTRKEGDANRSRGVHLSSETLGISGVLDVIEEKDGASYPVETKHGSAPRDDDGRPTTWDNDAVQLCGQALLMEEAFGGRWTAASSSTPARESASKCGSPRSCGPRRARPSTSAGGCRPRTPRRTRCRPSCGTAASAARWPRSACRRRRSTRSACPPAAEETAPPPAGITRVIPQSDDGAVLYVQEPGCHVGKRSEHLVVRKDGQEVTRVPMHAIRQVVVFGNVQVSTQALETLATNEIPVAYMTGYGRFIGTFAPAETKNVGCARPSSAASPTPRSALSLSKAVVRAS